MCFLHVPQRPHCCMLSNSQVFMVIYYNNLTIIQME